MSVSLLKMPDVRRRANGTLDAFPNDHTNTAVVSATTGRSILLYRCEAFGIQRLVSLTQQANPPRAESGAVESITWQCGKNGSLAIAR